MNLDKTAVMYLAGLLNRGSRSLPAAGLLTVLLLVLAQACTPAGKPATGHTLGVYGDWTAYRFEDGALEVCYVETGLIPVPGAEPDFSEVRLQVSNRAFNPGKNLVRLTLTHLYPHYDDMPQYIRLTLAPKAYTSLAALYDPEGYDAGGPFDDELVGDMISGDVQAVTLTRFQNWEEENGAHLGSYSMDGFSEAYAAISRACPLLTEYPARGAAQTVRIDGYATVEGPPEYYTFSLTGPFFEAGEADTLTIRGVPDNYSEFEGMDEETKAEVGPEYYFIYDAEQWEFYRNGDYVGSINSGYRTEITGLCLSPESERLKLLVHAWGGGATSPGSSLSVFYEPGEGMHENVHYARDAFGPGLVDCRDNESINEQGRPFRPCLCTGSAGNRLYHSTLEQLRSDITQAASTDEDARPRTIGDDTFNALLSRAVRLEPFIWWDAYSHLDVQRFESPKYAVVSLTLLDRTSVYGSFQQVFVRRLSEDVWTEVFNQQSSRYGFNTATIHGFHDESTVDLEMCFEQGPDADYQCQRHVPDERRLMTVEEWLR